MTARLRSLVVALAVAFFALHLNALPPTLEDIDSVNLALGVESFDVAAHRPHPPGYPVFIALAKLSTAAIGSAFPEIDRDRRGAIGLAIWGVLAGAVAAVVVAELWVAFGLSPLMAALAALLVVASPLFWLTASRPLTDTAGLVSALAVQTLLLKAVARSREVPGRVSPAWWWAAGAFGVLIGLRSQTLWLVGPLFAWSLATLVRQQRARTAAGLVAAAAAGVLAWAIPLAWDSGGLANYLRAVRAQGDQDLSGVELLVTMPSARLFGDALERTFVNPWFEETLGHVILVLAVIGIVVLARRQRRALGLMALSFLPYLLFHLAFQETVTTRYALPTMVPVTGLAVVGLLTAGSRVAVGATVALAAVSLFFVQPLLAAYSREGSPVFRGFQAMRAAVAAEPARPRVHMHNQVWLGLRRGAEWYKADWDIGVPVFPGNREWLELVRHWQTGEQRPVWLLADPKRNDLAVFDWRARRFRGRFEHRTDYHQLMGGTRLEEFVWWEFQPPGWMLGRGWSVTPEIGGVTWKDRAMPSVRAAEAFLRRTNRPTHIVIGGRYLSGSGAATVSALVDGRVVDEWTVDPSPEPFIRWIDLPAGPLEGSSPYAPLTVSVRAVAGTPVPEIGLEQFDAATIDTPLHALERGWQEPEGDPQTGRLWRWMSDRSTLRIRTGGRDARLRVAGESPLRYFDRPPTVVVRAGSVELGRFSPATDFVETIALPAGVVDAAGGEISIETNLTFVPAERGESADRRRLGLKVYEVEVRDAAAAR